MSLRPYQDQWLEKIAERYKAGITRQLGRACTGSGKTVLFSNLPDVMKLPKDKRMMVLVHREELASQAAEKLTKWNPNLSVGIEMGDNTSYGQNLVVAGIQTIGKKSSNRINKFSPDDFNLLVIDECFPAGTLVDNTPIEMLQLGDLVNCVNEITGEFSKKPITRIFKNKAPSTLVSFTYNNLQITCTLNHPIFIIGKGWLLAKDIKVGDKVLVDEELYNVQQSCNWNSENLQHRLQEQEKVRNNVPNKQETCLSKNEVKQPNEKRRDTKQSKTNSSRYGMETSNKRGQWPRTNGTGETVSRVNKSQLQCSSADKNEEGLWLPNLLQNRFRAGEYPFRSRSRRTFPQFVGTSITGQKESKILTIVRVDSVKVHEQTGSGRYGKLCPDGFVYNIEVAEAHTYFANGCLVHNCHHAAATTYMNVMDYMGTWTRKDLLTLGVTATPNRSDGKGLDKIFQEMVFDYPLSQGIREGWLAGIRGIRVKTKVSLDDVSTQAGDFAQNELSAAVNVTERNEEIVQAWLKEAPERQTVAFCVDIAHAKALAETFRQYGVQAEAIWGNDPDRECKLLAHERGEFKVLTNCQILTEGYDCLDCETQVLTKDGWKSKGQIKVGDFVYSLNKFTEEIELTPITRYIERPVFSGEKMLTIKSQHMDIRTTEGHEFHVKCGRLDNKVREFTTLTGKELFEYKGIYSIPLSAEFKDFPGIDLTDDELKFIAWFLTDGGFKHKKTAVVISQAKEPTKTEIRELLTRLGLDYTEEKYTNKGGFATENCLPLSQFRIPKGTRAGKYKRNGWIKYSKYLDKNIPSILHNMSIRQFEVFWNELLKGDGSNQSGKSGWLWCDKKSQVDAYTQMAVTRGFSASYKSIVTKYGTTVYRVSVRKARWISSDTQDKRAAKRTLTEAIENETVWCVTNKNSTLITRRNGKIAIIGNCWQISCIIMARPTQSSSLYEQIIGRGTRIQSDIYNLKLEIEAGRTPLKIDCLIIDVVDASKKHSLNNVATLFGLQEELDTKGRPIIDVVDELEEAEKKGIDTSRLTDFSKLDLFIEEVDLFKVTYPEEIIEISDFQWHKTQSDSYVLLLSGEESMVVKPDLLGNWHINGIIGDSQIDRKSNTFDTAIKEADMLVNVLGGRGRVSIAKRLAGWHKEKPTTQQLHYCKNLGIRVPEGSSKGEVAAALNRKIAEIKSRQGINANKRI